MSFKQFLGEVKETKYDYSSLLFELPEDLTDDIISWGFDNVPNESLFLNPDDPSFGREDDSHITLIYGIHTSSVEEVSFVLANEKEFKCELGEISLFKKNEKFDVLIVKVKCKHLHELNDKMRRELDATENYPVYVPHVTIAYLKKGHGDKYLGDKTFDKKEFVLDKIVFSSKTGTKTHIKLGSK